MQFEHLVHIFASPNWERLMLTLLHSLWQAPILASVVYVSLKAVPVRRANTRYGICLAGLLMTVVASLATWSILGLEMFSCTADSQATMMPLASHTPLGSSQKSAHSSDSSANSGKSALNTPVVWNAEQSNQDTATSEAYQQAVSQSVAGTADTGAAGKPFPWSAILAAGWLIGMVVMFVRLILIVTGAHRLKKQGRPVNNPELLAVIEQLRQLFGIRRSIRVLVGNALSSPAVAGLFWPTLLLPASMLTGTPAEAWLPILAHELTHIRRYDALVDLLQLMIETVLFFNPAVWWMSRQIRIEREACCDAMAVAITGEPLNYTRILADLAERTLLQSSTLSAMTSPLPATTAAFAGGGRQPLLDRAKRLLLPNYRPPMRLSWTVFGLALLVGVALFAGLWRGTSVAVELAAKVLTPQERMEQLQAAQTEYTSSEPSGLTYDGEPFVKGTILMSDGKPVPDEILVNTLAQKPGISSRKQFEHRSSPEFSFSTAGGSVWIGMQARGYAPTVVGPIAVKQKETVDNIEILLEPGYEATIRFVDEQGKTVDNVDLQGVIWCGNSSLLVQSWESDTDETLLVDHLAKIPYRLEAKAKGFEISRRELEFKPSETITWTLTRAKPTTGVIVDSKDKPVADAAIALAAEVQGNDIKQGVDWHAKTIALTDDQGRFSLEELTAKSTYLFFVKTPDQGRFLVRDIKPGQEDQRIQLPPELFIRGKVIGDLTQLKQNKGQPAISYSHDIKPIEHLSYSDSRLVPVEIKDGVGHFEIYDVLNTSCAISAGEKWVRFELTKPIDDLVIDLSQIPAQRRVIFKFKPTDGGPAPTGTVVLNAQGGDVHRGDQLEIEDGMIAIDAFVGGYVSCHANTMVGGSFKEQRIENLAAGEEPFVVEVPVTPAGAIIGTIVDEDGKPITQQNISVSASTVKPAPGEFEAGLIGSNTRVDPATGRFMITPVPLGGTYCARADIDKHIVLSQPIKVDTTRPTVTVELKKAKGIDTQVQVVDPSGKPIAGIPVHFGYGVYRNSYSYSDILTDETGSMWFRNLNPDSRISYFVSIPSKQTYCALSQVPLQLGKPNRIQLQPGLTLTGRVIDQDGQPIAEAKVHAYEPNSYVGYEAEAPTDEQGRFQLSNLPSGTFRIGANVPDSWWKRYKSFGYSESIKATAGQSEEVVVKLKGEPK